MTKCIPCEGAWCVFSKYSRTAMYKKKGLFKKAGKPTAKAAGVDPNATVTKKIGGDKNGGTRTILVVKPSKYYPTEDVRKNNKRTKQVKVKKVRASITPGTVLILLSGKFAGKRVICMKALDSGLLLVSGPFCYNGVPLKRVNQAYVIATSTKIPGVDKITDAKFTDTTFVRPDNKKNKPSGEFFDKSDEAKVIDPARVELQKATDAKLVALCDKIPHMKDYLRSTFSLRKGQFPHEMKF